MPTTAVSFSCRFNELMEHLRSFVIRFPYRPFFCVNHICTVCTLYTVQYTVYTYGVYTVQCTVYSANILPGCDYTWIDGANVLEWPATYGVEGVALDITETTLYLQ